MPVIMSLMTVKQTLTLIATMISYVLPILSEISVHILWIFVNKIISVCEQLEKLSGNTSVFFNGSRPEQSRGIYISLGGGG